MRSLVATMWLLTLTACSVNLEGAHCSDDSNCPKDQRCNTTTQKCVACVSDPECSDVGRVCSGDGTALLQCAHNSGSCFYSVRTDCGQAGCSAQKCNCPQNPGPDFYADTVASSQSGLFNAPTGVSDPPDCRFKTITEALDAANLHGSGSRAIATGGSDQNPVIFSAGETFPLEVKPGVTLTTSDTTPTPAHYVIEVAEAGPSRPVVQLNEDAAVAGFTIRPVGSGSASEAVNDTCSQNGNVSVSDVVIQGTALTATTPGIDFGMRISDGCSYSVHRLVVTGVGKTAVWVDLSKSADVTVSDCSLATNGETALQFFNTNATATPAIQVSNNTIYGNKAGTQGYGSASRVVGGVLFYGVKPSTMGFYGNRVYGNKGDQLLIYSGDSGWNLNGVDPSGAEPGSCPSIWNNVFGCYDSAMNGSGAGASAGVAVTQALSESVSATFNAWSYAPPALNREYIGPVDATGGLGGTDFCSPVSLNCP